MQNNIQYICANKKIKIMKKKKDYRIWVEEIELYILMTEKEAKDLKEKNLVNYNENDFSKVVFVEPIKKEKL